MIYKCGQKGTFYHDTICRDDAIFKVEPCHEVTCLPQVFAADLFNYPPCAIQGDFRLFLEIKLKVDVQLAWFWRQMSARLIIFPPIFGAYLWLSGLAFWTNLAGVPRERRTGSPRASSRDTVAVWGPGPESSRACNYCPTSVSDRQMQWFAVGALDFTCDFMKIALLFAVLGWDEFATRICGELLVASLD